MSDVRRFDLKQCTACKGTGKQTVYKEATWESAPCLTCLGEGYVAAPAPEDKPAAGMLYAALVELERTKAELREQSENNADLFRQMEAEAHRADEAEARYQRVAAGLADEIKALKAELAALKVGSLDIEAWAQKSYVVSTAAHRIITEKVSALLSRKGDD